MPEKNKDRLEKRLLAMNNVQEIDELNILSGRIKKLQEDDTPLTLEITEELLNLYAESGKALKEKAVGRSRDE